MDDRYDLVASSSTRTGCYALASSVCSRNPLESSAGSLSFAVATFAVVNIVFLMLFFSQFAILWIERKAVARMQDRYGATTALRSLWVGENGVTAGEWWNMLPFGIGKPVGAVNKWLNKNFGNRDENFATVDRVNNRSWMGKTIVPGFFQNVADGMKFLVKEHMVPQRGRPSHLRGLTFPHRFFNAAHLGNDSPFQRHLRNQPRSFHPLRHCHLRYCSHRRVLRRLVIQQQVHPHRWHPFGCPIDCLRDPPPLDVALGGDSFRDLQHHRQHSLPTLGGCVNIFLMPLGAALFLITMMLRLNAPLRHARSRS